MTTLELSRVNDHIDFIHKEIDAESVKNAPDEDLLEDLYSDLNALSKYLDDQYKKIRISEIGLKLI